MLRPYVGDEEVNTIARLEGSLYCPRCAADLSTYGFVSAFWQSEATVYFCWCSRCNWQGDISESPRVVGYEPEESPRGVGPHLSVVSST